MLLIKINFIDYDGDYKWWFDSGVAPNSTVFCVRALSEVTISFKMLDKDTAFLLYA